MSSREGLVRNAAFHQLVSLSESIDSCLDDRKLFGFFHRAMRKLEKFVVDGLDWDRICRDTGDLKVNNEDILSGNYKYLDSEKPVFETINSIIRIRSPRKYIEDIEINLKYLGELAQMENEKYEELIETLEEKFEDTPIDELKPAEHRDLSKFISRLAKELAQKDKTNLALEQQVIKAVEERKVEVKRRIFAELEATTDKSRIFSCTTK